MSQNFTARMFGRGNCNLLAGIGLLLIAFTGFALAHEGATGVVKERMDVMKGQAEADEADRRHGQGQEEVRCRQGGGGGSRSRRDHKKIPDLFPEGTNGHPSEALDTVWKEWDRFKGDSHDAESAANALAAALEASGQDWKAAFKTMTDACKSCHESFRAKEEDEQSTLALP